MIRLIEFFKKYTDLKILSFFLDNPKKEYYINELAKDAKVSSSSVSIAVKKFEEQNFILTKKIGQTKLCTLNNENVLIQQWKVTWFLTTLFSFEKINTIIQNSAVISLAVYGSYASGTFDDKSDLDILLITHIKKDQLIDYFQLLEEYLTVSVNVLTLTLLQWKKLKKENDIFYQQIKENHILISGSELI